MATEVSLSDFRDFSKLSADVESDSEVQKFLDTAKAIVSRICAKPYSDLEDSEDLFMAIKILALSKINMRSFPSQAIMKSVNEQVLSLLGGQIDTQKQFIAQADPV